MNFETTTVPVTRWKQGRRGVLPKTEGISKLINCTPAEAPAMAPMPTEEQNGKLPGYKSITETVCTVTLPEMPAKAKKQSKLERYEALSAWVWDCYNLESEANRNLKVVIKSYAVEPKLVEQSVPRGTFIGPRFEVHLPKPEEQAFIGPINKAIRDKSSWVPRQWAR